MAYYPDWAGSSFPPETIDFTRFDWIDFAFALPTEDFTLTWDDPTGAPDLLRRLAKAAHADKKKVKLSVGGWAGSRYFSSAVRTAQNRRSFVNNIFTLYKSFGLDGIDIDWEYPAQQGEGGNQVDPNDSANFLLFLNMLRTTLPSSAIITAATQAQPFLNSDGVPMKDVSQFAKVLNWILLMNYDVWGSSAQPGPNAPLYDACNNSSQPGASAVGGYNAWTSAGMPASQMVLGVPSYGYLSASTAKSLRTRSQTQYVRLKGDDQIQFRELINQGALVRSSTRDNYGPIFNGGGGFTRYWDKCSSTPYLRSPSAGQLVAYDDPQSLGMKAAFAKRVGMLGVNMFDIHGDADGWDLTDSVRRGLGLQTQ
ncbi:glycoside hydrolase [Mycena sp. CBHHK59/15]|nr:glycoside hydrolase [Mycena sp. CBHHK59/15]